MHLVFAAFFYFFAFRIYEICHSCWVYSARDAFLLAFCDAFSETGCFWSFWHTLTGSETSRTMTGNSRICLNIAVKCCITLWKHFVSYCLCKVFMASSARKPCVIRSVCTEGFASLQECAIVRRVSGISCLFEHRAREKNSKEVLSVKIM